MQEYIEKMNSRAKEFPEGLRTTAEMEEMELQRCLPLNEAEAEESGLYKWKCRAFIEITYVGLLPTTFEQEIDLFFEDTKTGLALVAMDTEEDYESFVSAYPRAAEDIQSKGTTH